MASGQGQPDYAAQQYIINLTKRVVDLERALIEVLDTFKQVSPGIDARHAAHVAEAALKNKGLYPTGKKGDKGFLY
jgi:hypothetical protein